MVGKTRIALPVSFKNDGKLEAGVDEAGRGCFWGPLVAGAVIWPQEDTWTDEHRELAPWLQDSKTLTALRRSKVAEAIGRLAISASYGSVSAKEIDENGMSWANHTAFSRAVAALSTCPNRLLIDGTLSIPFCEIEEQETIVDGDAAYLPIAAASIYAKVTHDDIIKKWCLENDGIAKQYGLTTNKGYGTAAHRRAISEYGVLEEHRRLFLKKGLKC